MSRAHGRPAVFLAPWLMGFIWLTALPLGASIFLAVTEMDPGPDWRDPRWVGAKHFRTALELDPNQPPSANAPAVFHWLGVAPRHERFYLAWSNTLIYAVVATPLSLVAALATALLLRRSFPGATLIRAGIYLPYLLGGVATIMMWSWLFNPRFGWINAALRMGYDGLDPVLRWLGYAGSKHWPLPDWLFSPDWCKPAVILMHMWTMGGTMLIFLAALRRISMRLYDAARLDGAGRFQVHRYITVPQLAPVVVFNTVISLVFSMQTFNESYLLQNRAQHDRLLFLSPLIYETAFESPCRLNEASAMAWILAMNIAALIVPLWIWSGRRMAVLR